jgi:hypothetical protein
MMIWWQQSSRVTGLESSFFFYRMWQTCGSLDCSHGWATLRGFQNQKLKEFTPNIVPCMKVNISAHWVALLKNPKSIHRCNAYMHDASSNSSSGKVLMGHLVRKWFS